MKTTKLFAGVVALGFLLAGPVSAGDKFSDRMDSCLKKHVSAKEAASVVLECNADAGKLSGCKVVENSAGGKGFDKAAVCVAEFLPMGAKSGAVRVPMKFPKPA